MDLGPYPRYGAGWGGLECLHRALACGRSKPQRTEHDRPQRTCEQMIELVSGIANGQLAAPARVHSIHHLAISSTMLDLVVQEQRRSHSAATFQRPDIHTSNRIWQNIVVQRVRTLGKAWDNPAAWEEFRERADGVALQHDLGQNPLSRSWSSTAGTSPRTDQPFDLPEPTMQACFDHVAVFVPNAPVPELWGPPVEVSPDASLLDRIVAITGRVP